MRFSVLALLFFVSLICGCLALIFYPTPVRHALPRNASEINEYCDGPGDCIHLLRAKIDSKDFEGFASKLGLTKKIKSNTEQTNSWPDLPIYFDEKWWDPPNDLNSGRIEPNQQWGFRSMATYHDGYVYYASETW